MTMSDAPTTPAAPTWFTGMDADLIGHIQTKGWDKLSPEQAAVEITRAHRAAEQHVGVPADQILRLPKDANDAEGWKATFQKLGAPADAKDYDFSSVTFDDEALSIRFQNAFRETASKLNMPKGMAEEFARSVYQ